MEINMDALVKHSLSPDEYVYLYCLVHDKELLARVNINIQVLELDGWIKIGTGNTIYKRQKSINLFKDEEFVYAKHNEAKMMEDNLEEVVANWREIFPKGVKTGGYPVRGTKGGCMKKMKKFIKSHKDITMKEIYDATRLYVKEKSIERYSYMKMADYFIEKDGGSMLEAYVERIREEGNPAVGYDQRINNLTDDI